MAKATIAKDVATLENIYGDEVTYSHSTSATQTKTQVLADIKYEEMPPKFMKFSETTIRLYGSVAVAKGIVDFRNGPPGQTLLDNHLNRYPRSRASCAWPALNGRSSCVRPRCTGRQDTPVMK